MLKNCTMVIGNGNGKSLAEAVRNEIQILPHTKTSLGEGIVNYSALARKLMPKLSDKLGKKLNEESVIVAIKRYSDEMGHQEAEKSYLDMFANSQITLQDNMCYTHFKKNKEVIEKVDKLFSAEDWKLGEMRVLIHGADQVMVIMKENRVRELLKELDESVINSFSQSSLLTLNLPYESYSTYGIIAEVTSLLAKQGISLELISSPPDLHILVDEKDAERTYSTFKQLIKDSQKALEEQK